MSLDEDKALVVAYLHHTGAHTDVLPSDDLWGVYCEGDGYGHLPPEMLAEINEGWDWSHVRDSTPEGWARMAGYLRERGYGIDGPSTPTP